MVDCNKRQKEVFKGTEQMRCIHPEAETYKEIVVEGVCKSCPLAGLLKAKKCCDRQRPQPATEKPTLLPLLKPQPEYPECPFRYESAEGTKCSITNLGVDPEICGRCDAEVKNHCASIGEKVTNYFGAVRRWAALGKPTRTPEEVKELFELHCKGCDRYDKEKHACKNCGCRVSTDSSPLTNKLAMASESCPLGRF